MPKAQFLSVVQRMIDCQIGSGIRFFGSDPASPGGWFWKHSLVYIASSQNIKAEVVKM